jgi:preprotein translocase subunit SecA
LERRVVLQVLDRKWREHLYEMDYLQEGIGLRAMAQRDPLVEYQREGFDMFNAMLDAIKEESVGFLFNVEVEVQQPAPEEPAVDAEEVPALVAPVVERSAPALTAKGLQTGWPLGQPAVFGADAGHHRAGEGRDRRRRRQQWRARPQRALPLRLGQEVQALPRRTGRAR